MNKALIIILLSALVLMGCEGEEISAYQDYQGESSYFKILSREKNGYVVYDVRTRVEYWESHGSYNWGTLTLLVDKDGNPLIYEGSEE